MTPRMKKMGASARLLTTRIKYKVLSKGTGSQPQAFYFTFLSQI